MSRLNDVMMLLCFGLLIFLVGCSVCKDEVIRELASPDRLHTAIASYRSCGATTSDFTRVIVKPSSKSGKEIEQVVFVARLEHRIALYWRESSELTIVCDDCTDEQITFQVSKIGALKISYNPSMTW
jgi:hypothetical protein